MTLTRSAAPRQVPAPSGSRPSSTSARFIPRDELPSFSSWEPGSFNDSRGNPGAGGPVGGSGVGAGTTSAKHQAVWQAAHQVGYQEGYRDGLAALADFKASYAQEVNAQFGTLLQSFDRELATLEQAMARSIARVAVQLARQVVREHLKSQPSNVARVAHEAVHAVLMSARHVVLRVHPDDHAIVGEGAAEAIAARGARLVADAAIERGGLMIDSDVGTVDARIATRWAQAVQPLGADVAWQPVEAGDEDATE